jgi:dihydrofolate reductase
MRLTLHMFLTLDGVLQSPGAPDEDPDGPYEHGGWSFPYGDEDFGATVDGWFQEVDAFLLGRKTYQIFAGYWPQHTDPKAVAGALNTLPKYVASTRLDHVEWHNTTIVRDVVGEVTKLKEQDGRELQVHGSGHLAQTLIEHDLVDEYRLLTFPVHLGSGKRLFREGLRPAALSLVSTTTTASGVVVATYRPNGAPTYGDFSAA